MKKKELLQNIPIFNGLDPDEIDLIIPLARPRSFEAGSTIIEEAAEGSSMYILLDGRVKITKSENRETEVFIAVLEKGSFFGELSLFDNLPRSANVIALTDCKMLHLKKDDFDQLLNTHLKISNFFYKNCLTEYFNRFRRVSQNFTFSQHILKETSDTLDEINKDLSNAKEVQNYFLSNSYLDNEDKTIAKTRYSYIYEPCNEVGGDFLNIEPVKDDGIAVMIADVVGHGVTAALATGVLKSAFSFITQQHAKNPAQFMTQLNLHYYRIMDKFYATAYYAYIDRKNMKATFAKGGHHPPLFWKKSENAFININTKGIGIGILDSSVYREVSQEIEEGDKILFFTDGILEQHITSDSREMFSLERLRDLFEHSIKEEMPDKLAYIKKEFSRTCNQCKIEDDITLLLLEI